jgi:hypothetical protein
MSFSSAWRAGESFNTFIARKTHHACSRARFFFSRIVIPTSRCITNIQICNPITDLKLRECWYIGTFRSSAQCAVWSLFVPKANPTIWVSHSLPGCSSRRKETSVSAIRLLRLFLVRACSAACAGTQSVTRFEWERNGCLSQQEDSLLTFAKPSRMQVSKEVMWCNIPNLRSEIGTTSNFPHT